MENFTKSKMSLLKALLIFYLIIGINYTSNLYSGQMIEFLKNNRYAQHFIGLSVMGIIVSFISEQTAINSSNSIKNNIIYTILAYLIFILSTKLDLSWNLLIIAALIAFCFIEMDLDKRRKLSEEDDSLEDEDLDKIDEKRKKIITYSILSLFAVMIIGSTLYLVRKRQEYGSDFDPQKFVFDGSKRYVLTQ